MLAETIRGHQLWVSRAATGNRLDPAHLSTAQHERNIHQKRLLGAAIESTNSSHASDLYQGSMSLAYRTLVNPVRRLSISKA
jgi:hypothetical protein